LGITVAAETPFNIQPSTSNYTMDDIILDIYNAATETDDVDFEQLQTELYALHESPIDLNTATEEDLAQLPFLSPQQIDDILSYVYRHPMDSLYELRLIPSLSDYEIRDLLPFVVITKSRHDETTKLLARDVFRNAKHELILRTDARNLEDFEGTDPMYIQTRYRFDYQRRVQFGLQLRRPAGGEARDLQYGAWIQLNDIGPFHTIVAGNFQASFGHGLVLAPVRHFGKIAYVNGVGLDRRGLRYYSSVDGEGLHGIGATYRHSFSAHTRLDVSVLYSLRRANDSIRHHLLGANITLRHKQMQVELTAIENLWSDSIHPYQNAAYNAHYFRGRRQAVLGASVRYNHGWFDLFGEVATSQNHQSAITDELTVSPSNGETLDGRGTNNLTVSPSNGETLDGRGTNKQLPITNEKWGIGAIVGSRFYPTQGLALTALGRYYSPYFDNALGYAFSETSRLGNEAGGYLGFLLTRFANWQVRGYADMFYFPGRKYGITYAPSWGYDALGEVQYTNHPSPDGVPVKRGNPRRKGHQLPITNHQWNLTFRARARKKGDVSTYSARLTFHWQSGPLSLRTTADANYVQNYGISLMQDLAYDFQSPMSNHQLPISLRLRLQGFDARNWDNRIYCYENDVLYAFSIPAVYGLGGRAYVCLRWQIISQLALYFRFSETLYAKSWATSHDRPRTRTDLHLLLRAKL